MCGICGFVQYGLARPGDRTALRRMMEAIRHRGPDDEGEFLSGPVALGNRRLSIIDLKTGKQPISNETGSVTVVFNGEIYNHRDIRSELQKKGHTFRTSADTEVLVHLYEEYGAECVHHLRGMFGFALWDNEKQRLLLARDRLGIKPLYYADRPEAFVFASEIKSILQFPGIDVIPDLTALSNFLSLKYVPAPETMFAGIRAIPPGHLLLCDSNGVSIQQYWDLSFQAPEHDVREEEYVERLEALLRESVRLRLMSDVPFGAFLSGGVDSSTIVALMSEMLNSPVKTFAVGFDEEDGQYSELPYARLVAEQYETDHHDVFVRSEHLTDMAETLIWHLDQPVADQAVLGNYMVAALAAQHVKMVLTGEGGDELFAGYARYPGERLAPAFGLLPAAARSAVRALIGQLPGQRRLKLAINALCEDDEVSRVMNWFPLFNPRMKAALLSDVSDTSAQLVFAKALATTDAVDSLSRMLYVDTKLWLPDDLLARGDKMSMAVSLEARVPLLDHELASFAASLPPGMKLRGLTRKYLLKKVSSKWLPPSIIKRKKEGFPMPFARWFRGTARPFVRDLLSSDTIRRRGLFQPTYVERLIDEHESGAADHMGLLWGLVSVELWYRCFVDRRPTVEVTMPLGAGDNLEGSPRA
jgi:asparagine synthase (glutamine-hydrolysing)